MKTFKKILLAIIPVFLNFNSFSQNIDSLKLILKNAKYDTTRIRTRTEIGEIALIFRAGYWDSIANDINKLLEQESEAKSRPRYIPYLASAYNNLGYIYQNTGDLTKALEYHKKSIVYREEAKDKEGLATSLNNIGVIYHHQGDVLMALEYWLKSLKIMEESKNRDGIVNSLNNIGAVYQSQGDIKKAQEYWQRCLKMLEGETNKLTKGTILNNIGYTYKMQGDNTKALEYFEASLSIRKEIGDKMGIAGALYNVGSVYQNRGDIPKALSYFEESLKIKEEINDRMGIAFTLHGLGVLYFNQKNISKAFDYANRSLKIAKELGFPKNISVAASLLKNIYQKQNNPAKALEMFELYVTMRDSMNNEETRKASIKKQYQYAYEKKAAADSLKAEEEKKISDVKIAAQEAQIKQEKTQRFALYGGLVLVITFAGFMVQRFKISQKQKKLIEAQKEEVEHQKDIVDEKQKEILDSIRYAKRIQTVLLPSEKYIEKSLSQLNVKEK